MSSNQSKILLREDDLSTEWFRIRNINKWIQKLWKPSFIGMYVGKYEGGWKDGQMHGTGTLRISRIFRGYLRNLGLAPFGWKLIDQGKYEGEWKNGLEHGHGTKTWPDEKKFIGKWKKGKYFHGTYYFDNGDKHFGFFKDGVAKGHGIRTYFDGRKHTGEFKCREERSEGTCILTGEKTVGRFIESIPTGFDTNKNYIGCQTVKYKEEKRASFISYFFHD